VLSDVCIAGSNLEGALELRSRIGQLALDGEGASEHVVGRWVAGSQGDRLFRVRGCFVGVTVIEQGIREVQLEPAVVWIDIDRPSKNDDRVVQSAGCDQGDREVVQRNRVRGASFDVFPQVHDGLAESLRSEACYPEQPLRLDPLRPRRVHRQHHPVLLDCLLPALLLGECSTQQLARYHRFKQHRPLADERLKLVDGFVPLTTLEQQSPEAVVGPRGAWQCLAMNFSWLVRAIVAFFMGYRVFLL
jgi:hypothetical protein